VFDEILALLRPGVTEQEHAAEIVYRHLNYGAERMAFDPIVASGPQGAKPHARPTGRAVERGDLVVMDLGCVVDGYASDMTRTVGVGALDSKEREVCATVLKAQKAAIEAARSGMSSKALDGVAREIIEEAGLGDAFSHGLGHGLGLEVHEWPRLSYHVDDELPDRCVVTIEPGVYLGGEFGIRIEDIVVLSPDGAEVLTESRKELITV
jgi:Xaa-Pro aminopeptidase